MKSLSRHGVGSRRGLRGWIAEHPEVTGDGSRWQSLLLPVLPRHPKRCLGQPPHGSRLF